MQRSRMNFCPLTLATGIADCGRDGSTIWVVVGFTSRILNPVVILNGLKSKSAMQLMSCRCHGTSAKQSKVFVASAVSYDASEAVRHDSNCFFRCLLVELLLLTNDNGSQLCDAVCLSITIASRVKSFGFDILGGLHWHEITIGLNDETGMWIGSRRHGSQGR